MLMSINATEVLTIRLLGIILVTSLLVIPPATARNLSRNLRQQILFSLATGLAGGVGGVALSYQLDAPCGSTIVLCCVALFAVSLVASRLRRDRVSARASTSA